MAKKTQLTNTEIQNRLYKILSVAGKSDKSDVLESVAGLLRDISPPSKTLMFNGQPMAYEQYHNGEKAFTYDFEGGDIRVEPNGDVYLGAYVEAYETIAITNNFSSATKLPPKEALERFIAGLPKALKVIQTILTQSKVK